MEKEALLTRLKEKLGSTQLGERTLTDYAASVAGLAGDAEITDDFLDAHVAILKSLNGNLHADVAEQVKQYKEMHPVPADGKKGKNPEGEATEDSPKPDYYSELMKKYEALEDRLNQRAAEERNADIRRKVSEGLKEKLKATDAGVNDYILTNTLRELSIPEEDVDVDKLVADMQSKYDANAKAAFGPTGAPTGNGAGTGGQDNALDQFFQKMADEGKFPKAEK